MRKEIWKEPGAETALDESQCPLWFWNDRLEEAELLRQLELKTDVGVKCTIPHARTNNGDGYIGGYLDDDWFEKIRIVLEYKKKVREPVWLYDEMDWPAGTCNKTLTLDERNREQYLSFQCIEVKEGESFRAQLRELHGYPLEGKSRQDTEGYAYQVFLVDPKTYESYSLQEYIHFSYIGATLDLCAPKDMLVYVVTIHVDSYDSWGAGCINYLDDRVTNQFLASTYEKYYEHFSEYFGNTIRCVFDDETRMANAFPWMKRLPKEFEKRKGYDILPHLVSLVLPGEEAGRIRCDYFDVIATLFQENYFKILADWCKKHGIRLYAHLLGEETLASQVRYNGDFLRQMRYLDICGVDHLGKGIGSLNIKFASCAARSYGKEQTAVEVFAGCGWELTFEEYIRMISWMFQQGVQIIINHGFFYSVRGTRKDDWPPSQFFQWKGFERMKEGNDMIRRLSYAMTGGVPETDILVYVPVESFWMDYIGNEYYKHGYHNGPKVEGADAARLDIDLQILLNELACENLDYDLIHRDAVANFAVEGTCICNKKNGQRFNVLLLPMCKMISMGIMRLISDFAQNGGNILILGNMPEHVMELGMEKECRRLVEEITKRSNVNFYYMNNRRDIYDRLKEIIKCPVNLVSGGENNQNFHPCYDDGLVDPYVHTGEDISGVRYVRYIKDGFRHTFFVNYDDMPKEVLVELYAAGEPELWNPFTGEILISEIVGRNMQKRGDVMAESFRIRLVLPCNYGLILVSKL